MRSLTLDSLVKVLPLLGGLVSAGNTGFSPAGVKQNRLDKRDYGCGEGYYCEDGYFCEVGSNGVPGCCPNGKICVGPGMVTTYTLVGTVNVVYTAYSLIAPSYSPPPTYSATPSSSYPTYAPSSSYLPSSYYPYPSNTVTSYYPYPTDTVTSYYPPSQSPCLVTATVNTCDYPVTTVPADYGLPTTTDHDTDYVTAVPTSFPPSCYVTTVLSTLCGYPTSVPTGYPSYNASSSAEPEYSGSSIYGNYTYPTNTSGVPPQETHGAAAVGAAAQVGMAGVVAAIVGLIMA